MSVLSWNCRGLGKPSARKRLTKLIAQLKPSIFFVQETKCSTSKVCTLCSSFMFRNFFVVDPLDLKGGLLLCWDDSVKVFVISSSHNWIFCKVVMMNGFSFYLSCVYGPPKVHERNILWDHLYSIDEDNQPWLLLGDFNQILQDKDKLSKTSSSKGTQAFNDILLDRGLFELNTLGGWYTWTNNRRSADVVWERLDRAFGNQAILNQFPTAHCNALTLYASDHSPILINLWNTSDIKRKKCFMFENLWLKEPKCHEIVHYHWISPRQGFASYQMVRKMKTISKSLEQDLHTIQCNLRLDNTCSREAKIREELEHLYDSEHQLWKQRAKQQWLKDCDRNTRYFQAMVRHRRNKNRILALKDKDGHWQSSHQGINHILENYFHDLYSNPMRHDQSDL